MSACDIGLRRIATVPSTLSHILSAEAESWDLASTPYNYNIVFGHHKMKSYHVAQIDSNISYHEHIMPVINWLCDMAGGHHKVVRCFLNLMEPNTSFRLHVDTLRVHKLARRFHIPITNTSDCTYYTYRKDATGSWVESQYQMESNVLYELDNINPHNVKNTSGYRINFIADVIDINLIDDHLTDADIDQLKFLSQILSSGLQISR